MINYILRTLDIPNEPLDIQIDEATINEELYRREIREIVSESR